MANVSNPLPHLIKRESGLLPNLKSHLFRKRLEVAKNLYRRELVCHFGCVNAIEFSSNGELLVSGGDDRRVMVWQFGKAVFEHSKPVALKAVHQSNIFCLGITNDNQKVYSGGNDDLVIVHDLESKCPLEVLQHQRAVCSLSIDPFNDRVVATAGNDGRLLIFDTRQSVHESLVISRSRKAFHGVMFHPQQVGALVSANAKDGVALWDLRSPKHPVIRYNGAGGASQNSMSVRVNAAGTHVLALRRRLPPVLYAIHSPSPVAQFYHQDYYNSCTMKSCCFAGERDELVLSGSDDFNLYMWRVPDAVLDGGGDEEHVLESPHMVLYGHRSIVNQVRYNPQYCLLASSGVEKIIKIWSAMEFPGMRGTLLQEAQGSDNPREIYSHEDYVSLVHHSGQYISHNYAEQSTREDPRMMAFFDSLVQRELECLAEETDSLNDGSSSPARDQTDDSDSDQIVVDFLPLPPKRTSTNGARSQRCPNRLARLVASRYSKNLRSPKRGLQRHSKQTRAGVSKSHGRRGRRAAARLSRGARALGEPAADDDRVPQPSRSLRPSRRHSNLSRSSKRKSKSIRYKKLANSRNNGTTTQDSSDNNAAGGSLDDNPALPSTSTGYRGQNTSALFRIAEVDSDDEQSAGSRPSSPPPPTVPSDLVSVVPTPVNGSRDSLADTLHSDHASPPHTLRTILRRFRRNGRAHRSDSSESPPPKPSTSVEDHLHDHNRTVTRLMNETNESEVESSCSTESSFWSALGTMGTPDSGVGTVVGSSTRNNQPAEETSEDPDYKAVKFRQRVKKARRNYRTHLDSDSN